MLLYIHFAGDKLITISFLKPMKASFTFTMLVAVAAVMATGCAGPEKKFGRGMANVTEVVRWGELRREVEQTGVFYSPEEAYTWGVVAGLNKSLARTGLGIYEMVTFPIPTYDPIWTDYLTPDPAYPANYQPSLVAGPNFDTDTSLGFSGGDVAPFVPGSRFFIFDPVH
jgi:putative exosortase-associated protein (TIGR04073 family)